MEFKIILKYADTLPDHIEFIKKCAERCRKAFDLIANTQGNENGNRLTGHFSKRIALFCDMLFFCDHACTQS